MASVSDIVGARELMKDLPDADYLLADKGYDADWFREELRQRGVEPCILPMCHRKIQLPYNIDSYKRRHKIENMFGRLKDWHPIATCYNRCVYSFDFVLHYALPSKNKCIISSIFLLSKTLFENIFLREY